MGGQRPVQRPRPFRYIGLRLFATKAIKHSAIAKATQDERCNQNFYGRRRQASDMIACSSQDGLKAR
jgi:hypothetical protein